MNELNLGTEKIKKLFYKEEKKEGVMWNLEKQILMIYQIIYLIPYENLGILIQLQFF